MARSVEVNCATCGKAKNVPLSQYQKSKTKKFFCNKLCKGISMKTSINANCDWCGKEIEVRKFRIGKFDHLFCDKICAGLFGRKRVLVNCDWCSKPLELRPSERDLYPHHFCDMNCRKAWQSENIKGESSPLWRGGKKFVLNCSWCNKEILVHEHRTKSYDMIFCDKECRSHFLSQNMLAENNPHWKGGKTQVPCDGCGKIISIRPSSSYEHHFCSKECMGKTMSGPKSSAWNGGKVELKCENCGKTFLTSVAEAQRGARFCSLKCSKEKRKNGKEFECTFCGAVVYRSQSQIVDGRLPFCNQVCKDKYFSGANSPNWNGGSSFEPYSPEFKNEIRHLVRDRDSHICQMCGAEENGKTLAVHHIDYCKQNDDLMNLISLCRHPCHQSTNVNRDYWKDLFQNIMKERFPD